MTKIGIIRCQESAMNPDLKLRCAGWGCLSAASKRIAYFDEYDEVELVGIDTCGGCPGGKGNTNKIVGIGRNMKEHGVEVIHLGSCIAGFCPNKNGFIKALTNEVGMEVKERTHGMPDGKRFPVGADGKPLMPDELYAKAKTPDSVQDK